MEKSRLGISVGLLAAILYLMGLINLLGLILLAGYVLLFENNLFLRRAAVKSLVIYAVFSLIGIFLGIIGDVFGFFNVFIGWFFSFRLDFPLGVDRIIQYAASIIETLLYLALAATALRQGTIPLGPIDKAIDSQIQ